MPLLITLEDYEQYAKRRLPKQAYDYYASGSEQELTLQRNIEAYSRLFLFPKVLVNVSNVNTATTILDLPVTTPILIAPTAMQRMAHPDGEIATAKAAYKKGIVMTLSSWSTTRLEDVAEANEKNALLFFQLYIYKDRVATQNLVKRAIRAGYKAIVITVDTPYLGKRYRDMRNNFSLPKSFKLANFDEIELAQIQEKQDNEVQTGFESSLANYVANQIDPSLDWNDIAWVQQVAGDMPILLKGILRPEDALQAEKMGIRGIIVSNHGGRQADGAPATIEALPNIVKALEGKECQVFVDGGIRKGSDIFKALALGAKAVFVGRPILWGLAYQGEKGVNEVLDLLNEELKLTMGLCGCPTIPTINGSFVLKERKELHSLL